MVDSVKSEKAVSNYNNGFALKPIFTVIALKS